MNRQAVALYDLLGTAELSPSNGTLAYRLMLYRPQDNLAASDTQVPFLNVTPTSGTNRPLGALDANGFQRGSDVGGYLGRLDLSGVPNGTYDLQLTVHGNGQESNVVVTFILDSQCKVGRFAFSEQDLNLPVNGMPLTVTRSYDSMNPNSADFGVGWSYNVASLNVQLDEQRTVATVGGPNLPFDDLADGPGTDSGPRELSVRTGGGRDVTLTLPDGRQTTFVFSPQPYPGDTGQGTIYQAQWKPPGDVHATLTMTGPDAIYVARGFTDPIWEAGGYDSSWESFDVPGWVLTMADGTQYNIKRTAQGQAVYQPDPVGNPGAFVTVNPYGPPTLTSIVEPTKDSIVISPNGLTHYDPSSNATRSVWFDRDAAGRIVALHDSIGGSNGPPVAQYRYNQDTGNLVQVLKLVDRTAGTYATNQYDYNNPNFPHYITSIENGLGVPIVQNLYNNQGRLTNATDANGNTTTFIHNSSSQIEQVVDALNRTNTYFYDTNGNVLIQSNALGQVNQYAYDGLNNKTNEVIGGLQTNNYAYDTNSFLLQSVTGGLMTNTFTYTTTGQVTSSLDGNGNLTTNYYDSNENPTATITALSTNTMTYNSAEQLSSSVDALGNYTTNTYDSSGNVTNVTMVDAANHVLSVTGYAYDQNGNRTNQSVQRTTTNGVVQDVTSYRYDGLNRLVATIEPDGSTNTVTYDLAGHQVATTDGLGHTTGYAYDPRGNLVQTTYPDTSFERRCMMRRTSGLWRLTGSAGPRPTCTTWRAV